MDFLYSIVQFHYTINRFLFVKVYRNNSLDIDMVFVYYNYIII